MRRMGMRTGPQRRGGRGIIGGVALGAGMTMAATGQTGGVAGTVTGVILIRKAIGTIIGAVLFALIGAVVTFVGITSEPMMIVVGLVMIGIAALIFMWGMFKLRLARRVMGRGPEQHQSQTQSTMNQPINQTQATQQPRFCAHCGSQITGTNCAACGAGQ